MHPRAPHLHALPAADPCAWSGVGCYQSHVEGLQQDHNGLTGTLPASLSSLQYLADVYLQGNSLQGPVPTFLTTLTQLANLDLSSNVCVGQ